MMVAGRTSSIRSTGMTVSSFRALVFRLSWKLTPLTFGPVTLLWCGHVYKFSHLFRNRELCEWPVREGTRLSAQSRLSRFERAAQLHPQALRFIPLALSSRLPQMRALLAPVSEETA